MEDGQSLTIKETIDLYDKRRKVISQGTSKQEEQMEKSQLDYNQWITDFQSKQKNQLDGCNRLLERHIISLLLLMEK